MATASELLPPSADVTATARSRTVLRFAGAFVLSVLGCSLLIGVALLAFDVSNQGRVLPGVRVGGVDVSGLDGHHADLALAAAFSGLQEGRLVIHTEAGDVHVPYRAFSRRADVETMAAAAMGAGRSSGGIERMIDEVRIALHGLDLPLQVAIDEEALAAAVADALAQRELEPIDATVAIGPVGIEVSIARPGRTFDAAAARAAALAAVADPAAPAEVAIDAAALELRPAVDDADVMAAVDAAERLMADLVVADGSKTWTIPASTVRSWLRFETSAEGALGTVVDEGAIPAALASVAKDVLVKPVEASYLVGKSGTVVGVTASREGRRLDEAATTAAVVAALGERSAGREPGPVPIAAIVVAPELTTEEARKTAPLMVRLSSWKTWFPIGERNAWGANIWLPAQIINGTVLDPGETFEWWRAIGPVTSARGFGMGGFIAGDHTDPTGALGGGMCSSSTTLFNAALRAGLQMGARDNHKYYINRYPLGLDATVSMSRGRVGQTVTFTNDMDTPILIRGFKVRSGGKGWVRYEIWGVPDGRQVAISKPSVTNVRKAVTQEVEVGTLPTGVRRQTEWPSNGMDVSVTRVVRDGSGRVIHRETYRSNYQLWNGRIEIGR